MWRQWPEHPPFPHHCLDAMWLRNLRLPFAIEICCQSGRCQVSEHRRSKTLDRGACIRMPAYRKFRLEMPALTPGSDFNALHLALSQEMSPVGPGQADTQRWSDDSSRPITLRVARAVFAEPGAPWSRPHAAGALKMSAQWLSAQMLREGSALMEIVREQRLMRVLVDMACNDRVGMQSGPTYGFCSLEQLQSAFFDRFGISLDRYAAEQRHCALTWSGIVLSAASTGVAS